MTSKAFSLPPENGVTADPSDNTTLTEILASYHANGYDTDFGAEEGASIRCGSCSSVVEARRMSMESIRRMEGASDPSDMIAVVATTCPVCSSSGTLVLGYGPMASSIDEAVMVRMQDGRHIGDLPPDGTPDEAPSALP